MDKKDPLDKLFLGKVQSKWFNKGKENERLKVKMILDNLDTELVCLDFKRLLSKKDYQIIGAFFDEINKARELIGFKPIKHSDKMLDDI
jgi:hypothetical protein|tara:strand:+ start:100 stop:366 length:267 start_codon:yes stop_codon:yes gene_type:complete